MGNFAALRALLLTNEEATITGFSAVCAELGIEAQSHMSAQEIGERLNHDKYAAVVVDLSLIHI